MDSNILEKEYDEKTRSLIQGMVEAEEHAIASRKNKQPLKKNVNVGMVCSRMVKPHQKLVDVSF